MKFFLNARALPKALFAVAFATTAAFTLNTAVASTIAIGFTGTELPGVSTGNFATEVAPLGQVTGSLLIDSSIPFSLTAGVPNLLDSGILDINSVGAISSTVTFGSITETFDTSTPNSAGTVQINEGPPTNPDSIFVNLTKPGGARFDFQLLETTASELFTGDASLGFSLSLLQSINLANSTAPIGSVFFSTNGNIQFSIDSIVVRAVDTTGVNVVPLPAGFPLLLTGLGGVLVLRRRSS